MSAPNTPSKKAGKARQTVPTTPSNAHPSGFTPINATTPSTFMAGLQLDTPTVTQHQESALRSTINAEAVAEATASGPAAPPAEETLQSAASSDEDEVDLVIPPAATQAPPAPRQVAASFTHPMASHDDPDAAPRPGDPRPSVINREGLRRAIAGADTPRELVFPHNVRFQEIESRAELEAYLNPDDPLATIHDDDLIDFEGEGSEEKAHDMLKQLLAAALQGYDIAPRVDHDKGNGQGTIEDNKEWNQNWDDLLSSIDLPIVKGAAAVGYRVAKREQLKKDDRVNEFSVCEHDSRETSGCLTNQYRSEAARSAISNYFGRNKNDTRLLSLMPTWCRKHYQKEAYSDEGWQKHKTHLIKTTLKRFVDEVQKEKGKTLTFEIKLREKDNKRVVEEMTKKGTGEPAANDKHAPDLELLKKIYSEYTGSGKTIDDGRKLVDAAYEHYQQKIKEWKEGKDEKTIRRDCKKLGPKLVEFQFLPEFHDIYDKRELAKMLKEAPRRITNDAGPVSNVTKRPRGETVVRGKKNKKKEDDIEEEEQEEDEDEEMRPSPSKKLRKDKK